MDWPDVILVNGPSSAGKTTLCRRLQARLEHPYLCLGFDDILYFSAPRYYRGADTPQQAGSDMYTAQGVRMHQVSAEGEPPDVRPVFGPVFRRLIAVMAPVVRTLVEGGNSVIFDHVVHDQAMMDSCTAAFTGLKVFSVGVTCDLDILEERERARGDRVHGRARGLVDSVHGFCTYDLLLDSGRLGPEACVDQVIAALQRVAPRVPS
ncbi:MAG: AAA family ATPase [Synechococcaceae cyanobacterium ELA445]